ncbi:AraC family transcriptional regulator [Kiloniella spongiae]|uniref:AraC family transcriptional regulator n=1 Tax=Kiloniella spongiae TaxID=1489064 RepID=A0A0H2MV02_9PROT|nr:GlxA family transcriptional regulator [Kiloniella spongiae]KLN60515.1 AraC family transcriptional regulator [Kiloniella spongiae]
MTYRSTPTNTLHTKETTSLSVAFILLPNFTLTPFSSVIDTLRLAADDEDYSRPLKCRWSIISTKPGKPVKSSCGVEITPSQGINDLSQYDYLVVVGGLLHKGPQADHESISVLQKAAAQGVSIIGLCTGSFAMIRAGLMQGRRCCVSWYHYNDFLEEFADVKPVADQVYVIDGKRITCAGGAGALDLAAWLVEKHLGKAVAQKSLRILQVDRVRSASAPQPQPPTVQLSHNERVRKAVLTMEQNMSVPLSVEELASRVNISKRQLERTFSEQLGVSPQACYRDLRLRHGLWQLLNTDKAISDIAADCGFSDASHFSRHFSKTFKRPPSTVRSHRTEGQELLEKLMPENLTKPEHKYTGKTQ